MAAVDESLDAPTAILERRLQYEDFTVLSRADAGGGVMGARRLRLAFRDGFQTEAKWKAAPLGGDGWNNSPRREIGAYAAQALFLDRPDYPIPPVVGRGIGLDAYRSIDPTATANIAGTQCVFGALAAWIQHAIQPARAFDRRRFEEDPRYAFHFGNLNLLAYLIAHRDARANNFLMPVDRANPRVFSIDNGIAFGGVLYNFFTWHFNEIRTSALPRQSVDRLRSVSRADLSRLGVLCELETNAAGILCAAPLGSNLDPDQGFRGTPGRIQLGLTSGEIDAIEERRVALLARIDSGDLAAF